MRRLRSVLPGGITIAAALLLFFIFGQRTESQSGFRVATFCILSVAAMLAARTRSLRIFLSLLSLAVLFAASVIPFLQPALKMAALVTSLNLLLVLLAEDSHFDWEAAAWWSGLLAFESAALAALQAWTPDTLAALTHAHWSVAGRGSDWLTLLALILAIALLGRMFYLKDPVSAGLAWSAIAIVSALHPLTFFAGHIGMAALVLGIAATERFHQIAYNDELTGLPGRRAFNEAVAALGSGYTIAIVDVDHFKKFNDTFGHDTGDQVLRRVAAQLSEVRHGAAFRCGGEEFAVVFPQTSASDALAHAEALREAIQENVFVVRGPERSARPRSDRRAPTLREPRRRAEKTIVTVSIGLAEPLHAYHDVRDVIQLADSALYIAKRNGRNRVETARALPLKARQAKEARA